MAFADNNESRSGYAISTVYGEGYRFEAERQVCKINNKYVRLKYNNLDIIYTFSSIMA